MEKEIKEYLENRENPDYDTRLAILIILLEIRELLKEIRLKD